jgi:type II secretory ATPase GspE/PulE/Tfp pilus assembly ATPase PilB-like protein
MDKIDVHIINSIKKELAIHYRVVPYELATNTLKLYADETAPPTEDELEIILDKKVEILNKTSLEIEKLLSIYYLSSQEKSAARHTSTHTHFDDFLDEIIHHAISSNSSDIHIEIYEEKARVRYRIDGMLVERYHISNEDYPVIVNKIKVRSNLDIAEKRLPQDGRINYNKHDLAVDIRVSILPTFYGEKAVLRLLRTDNLTYDLNSLGMEPSEKEKYLNAIYKPNGIVLISGPTGSGKTTTLYASLTLLNNKTKNILTIENPIEYTIAGINQVQINEDIGLSFASALRSFLRQDPDIIMIGEIRDRETAEMAIRASLTGHLVLSTIHTNSAVGTISRLQDMGIPSFLLAETLNISIAQRLIRKLCPKCKQKELFTDELKEKYKFDAKATSAHYKPVGCNNCLHTGYKGRIAIYDMIANDSKLQSFIKSGAGEGEFEVNGLKKRAIELFENGVTSLEEVMPYLLQ